MLKLAMRSPRNIFSNKLEVYVKMSDNEKQCRAICISTDTRCTRGIMMGDFCITHYRIFSSDKIDKLNNKWFKWRGNENGNERIN